MPNKIEDIMPLVWPVLQKLGLDDLQIYRVWQAMTGTLAAEGWLRKRPGKKQRFKPIRVSKWDELDDAKKWVQGVLKEFPELKSKSGKKDSISTTDLISEGAREERNQARAMGRDVPDENRGRRRKRESQW